MAYHPDRSTPVNPARQIFSTLLRGYLALFLAGCAGARPAPTREEARETETRTLEAGCQQAFDAVVTALQDLSFSINSADPATGLIVAGRETEAELAEISKDPTPGEKKDMPTWAKVALVATGVIVVVGVVAALSHDDGSDHHGRRHHRDDHDTEVLVVNNDVHPSGPPVYHYEITVNLKALSGEETTVRVSGQGTKSQNGSIEKAGPIHDSAFFDRFFSHVDGSLRMPMESMR